VKNGWPRGPAYYEFGSGEDWIAYVKDMPSTCKSIFHSLNFFRSQIHKLKFVAQLLVEQLITEPDLQDREP